MSQLFTPEGNWKHIYPTSITFPDKSRLTTAIIKEKGFLYLTSDEVQNADGRPIMVPTVLKNTFTQTRLLVTKDTIQNTSNESMYLYVSGSVKSVSNFTGFSDLYFLVDRGGCYPNNTKKTEFLAQHITQSNNVPFAISISCVVCLEPDETLQMILDCSNGSPLISKNCESGLSRLIIREI